MQLTAELAQIEWRDVHLDAQQPFITVRASVAKNHSHAMQPLTSDAVDGLRELQLAGARPNECVFAAGIPRMEQFRNDLKAAGIEYVDSRGERVDFHALRKTFGTMLTLSGVGQRTVMELMRYSDPRLTLKTYMDANLLPVSDAVVSLMRVRRITTRLTNRHILVPERPVLSMPVPSKATEPKLLTA